MPVPTNKISSGGPQIKWSMESNNECSDELDTLCPLCRKTKEEITRNKKARIKGDAG